MNVSNILGIHFMQNNEGIVGSLMYDILDNCLDLTYLLTYSSPELNLTSRYCLFSFYSAELCLD